MKQGKQLSAVAAAVMMALASGGVHALGLGVPNTRAILGETLRMSVPLELEQGEDTDDGCPQAEVFYGESRLDAGKVILGVSPQSGRNRVFTVRAIQPIKGAFRQDQGHGRTVVGPAPEERCGGPVIQRNDVRRPGPQHQAGAGRPVQPRVDLGQRPF